MPRLLRIAFPIALSICSHAAPAARLPVLTFGSSPPLGPGQVVALTWDRPPGSVRELELLLSLDGGRTFPLRLTKDLDGDTTRHLWRVPALASESAVVAVRARRDGVAEGDERDEEADGVEAIVATSEKFTIRADSSARCEVLRFGGGEWRAREAWDGGLEPPSGSAVRGSPGECVSSFEREMAAEREPRSFSGAAWTDEAGALLCSPRWTVASHRSMASRAPLTVPKRQ